MYCHKSALTLIKRVFQFVPQSVHVLGMGLLGYALLYLKNNCIKTVVLELIDTSTTSDFGIFKQILYKTADSPASTTTSSPTLTKKKVTFLVF